MIKKTLAISVLLFSSTQSFAQSIVKPGEYISKGGWGNAVIRKEANNSRSFNISSLSAYGHSCRVQGKINNGVSVLDAGDKSAEKCTIKFTAKENNVEINANKACEVYCGESGSFDGEYLPVAHECKKSEVENVRTKAHMLYKAKKYDEALLKLEPLLKNCSETLTLLEQGWIKNDLAATYAKLNRYDDCSTVLELLKYDTKMTEKEAEKDYPPFYKKMYWPILRETEKNMQLCKIDK